MPNLNTPASRKRLSHFLPVPDLGRSLLFPISSSSCRHDPNKPPTNSTLGLGNTWTGGVRNVDGNYPLKESEKKLTSKTVGTFGKTLGSYKADPTRFLKSYEKHPPLAYPTRFHYTDVVEPRPRPPRRDEIQARVEAPQTDFVTKNQVEAIVKGTKTLGGGWVGERAKQAVSGVDVVGSFGAPPPVATIGTVKMSGTKKGTRGLGANDHAEMQLEAARRADIEAIVRGQALDNGERKARMSKIKRLQKTTERSKSTEPGAKSQMMRDSMPSRPATVMSNYEEGLTVRWHTSLHVLVETMAFGAFSMIWTALSRF